jgi:ribonucleotide monophosphatase NagD (HAD superfamily)
LLFIIIIYANKWISIFLIPYLKKKQKNTKKFLVLGKNKFEIQKEGYRKTKKIEKASIIITTEDYFNKNFEELKHKLKILNTGKTVLYVSFF